MLRLPLVYLCMVTIFTSFVLHAKESYTPYWEIRAESFPKKGLPDKWRVGGAAFENDIPKMERVSINGRRHSVIRLPNEEGKVGFLYVPFPGLSHLRGGGQVRFEITIGADYGGGRGPHWYIKKGDFDLRAQDDGVYLKIGEQHLLPLSSENFEGELIKVELDYYPVTRTITAAYVNGKKAEGIKDIKSSGLFSSGNLQFIASTNSGKAVWLKKMTVWTGGAAVGADTEKLPRWLKPKPADPQDTPIPPLPTWAPVENADEIQFVIDSERLRAPHFSGEVLLTREAFAQLDKVLASDRAMQSSWETTENMARRLLKAGDWSDSYNESNKGRYTYRIRGILPRFALLYAATGQEDLGRMLRVLILDLVRRPDPFWIHSELRHYDPNFTQGRLETAELVRGLSLSFQWTQDLFSEAEREEMRKALIEKGLDPSLRWLEFPSPRNNFMAVIGGGALVAAKVLEDEPAAELAASVMEEWLQLVEDDGSYSEPVGYFEYGIAGFFYGWWALGREEGKRRLQGKSLDGSLKWMAAHYVLHDKNEAWKVNFGDDDFKAGVRSMVALSLAYAYDQGIGTWMGENLSNSSSAQNIYEFLFNLESAIDPLPAPVAPAEAKLPLAAAYDDGLAIIRSGWTYTDDIVFALRGGGGGRTKYSHDRANRNAFVLFVDGEYVMAAPGRSSYRNPIKREWDWKTSSHNTITINGNNQIRERLAILKDFQHVDSLTYLASEAAPSYKEKPEKVLREMWFLHDRDIIILKDTVKISSQAEIGWHLLLANHDRKSVLNQREDGGWELHRPSTQIAFWVNMDSPSKVVQTDGIMHERYSYSPGDPGEGTWGSAFHLTFTPDDSVEALHVWTLILPRLEKYSNVSVSFNSATQNKAGGWILQYPDGTVENIFVNKVNSENNSNYLIYD